MRFLAGLLVGLVAGAAGVWFLRPTPAPVVASVPAPPPAPAPGPKRRPKSGARPASPAPSLDEAPPPALDAEDLREASAGDALRAGATTVDMAAETEIRNLAQEEIDAAFARGADDLIACIHDARAGASLGGKVIAGVVVGADGRVVKTRVEAPAWLVRHGLYGCARPILLRLRFPAAGKETIVTVPFNLSE